MFAAEKHSCDLRATAVRFLLLLLDAAYFEPDASGELRLRVRLRLLARSHGAHWGSPTEVKTAGFFSDEFSKDWLDLVDLGEVFKTWASWFGHSGYANGRTNFLTIMTSVLGNQTSGAWFIC